LATASQSTGTSHTPGYPQANFGKQNSGVIEVLHTSQPLRSFNCIKTKLKHLQAKKQSNADATIIAVLLKSKFVEGSKTIGPSDDRLDRESALRWPWAMRTTVTVRAWDMKIEVK
jgi:hypothetical protein